MDFTATGYFEVHRTAFRRTRRNDTQVRLLGQEVTDGYSLLPNMNCKIICEDCVDAKCRCNLVNWESMGIIFKIRIFCVECIIFKIRIFCVERIIFKIQIFCVKHIIFKIQILCVEHIIFKIRIFCKTSFDYGSSASCRPCRMRWQWKGWAWG